MQIDPNCQACELHASCRTVCIAADGVTERADVLFVGAAPSDDADEQGRPFVESAGRLLRKAIDEFGLGKYRVALTNTVKCKPPGDKEPTVKQVRACAMYLEEEIANLKPRFIVPLGNVALRALTGKTGITKYIGRQIPHKSGSIVFPMIHPTSVFYDESRNQPIFESGFEMLLRALQGRQATTKNFKRVTRLEMAKILVGLTARKATYALDFETGPTGSDPEGNLQGNPHFAKIDCMAIAWGARDQDVAWCEWGDGKGAKDVLLLGALLKLLRSGARMIAQNGVFEAKWLMHLLGLPPHFEWDLEDTLLFHHLLDENQSHGLEVIAATYTDMGGYDNEVSLMVAEGRTHHEIWLLDPEALGRYCAGDTLATFKAWMQLRSLLLADAGLWRVWTTVTKGLIFSVAWAELNGRKIDFSRTGALRKEWEQQADEALADILDDPSVKRYVARRAASDRPIMGGVFNPASAQQVSDIVFHVLRLPCYGKTKGGAPSIKAEFIEPFKNKSPWIAAYLVWKGRKKAIEKIDEAERLTAPNGFLYGSYLIHGTTTGRPSSSNPNLQNYADEVRTIVVPRWPDGVIVEADYSQLELRLFAWASDCEYLLDAFRKGHDPHSAMASRMYHVPKPDKDQRFKGKTANFLLWNGGGSTRLRFSGGLSAPDADEVFELFHAATPHQRRYARGVEREAKANPGGEVRSPVGRLRRVPDIHSFEVGMQRAAAREAANAPVQGTASDINSWAFTMARRLIGRLKIAALGLGITHDSGTYEAREMELPRLVGMLKYVMEVAAPKAVCPQIDVPFGVEIKVGTSWGSLEPYTGPVIAYVPTAPVAVGR